MVRNSTNTQQAKIDAYIRRVVAEAPPLTSEQRNQLAELLRPVRGSHRDQPCLSTASLPAHPAEERACATAEEIAVPA